MKTIIYAILLSSSIAFGQPDTSSCTNTAPNLKKIIESRFAQQFNPAAIDWLIGVWKKKNDIDGQSVEVKIDKMGPLKLQGFRVNVCPQVDGTLYVYIPRFPSNYASVKILGPKKLTLFQANSEMRQLVDTYLKQ